MQLTCQEGKHFNETFTLSGVGYISQSFHLKRTNKRRFGRTKKLLANEKKKQQQLKYSNADSGILPIIIVAVCPFEESILSTAYIFIASGKSGIFCR